MDKKQYINAHFVKIGVSGDAHEKLQILINEKIYTKLFSLKQIVGRIILNILFKLLNIKVQTILLNIIKKRGTKKVYKNPESFFIYNLLAEKQITITPAYPDSKKFYIGLTLDIDNKLDFKPLAWCIEDLLKKKLTATVNLLTHADYVISPVIISDLQKDGFEIGLHGDTHNSALSFLPKRIIKQKLKRAIDTLGFTPFGIRTPGLSFNDNLIEVLDELGFMYDSSLTTGIAMYKSNEFPYVFRYKNSGIIEVPLFLQDYNFFVNDRYSEKETVSIFKTQISSLSNIGGIALLNVHPSIAYNKKYFWEKLLDLIAGYKNDAYHSTIYGLIKNIL